MKLILVLLLRILTAFSRFVEVLRNIEHELLLNTLYKELYM